MENTINPTFIKIPGKVFILGEYAVLAGSPALLVAPSQEVEYERSPGSEIHFHPQSPAGLIATTVQNYKRNEFHFEASGFGSSTADFIFVSRIQGASMRPQDLFAEYKKRCGGSGADLLTQVLGGWIRFQNGSVEKLSPPTFAKQILLFSAAHQQARKVKTHEHLVQLNAQQLLELRESLEPWVARGFESLRLKNAQVLGEVFTRYAEILSEEGLEHPETRGDREEFNSIAGVYGAKGCGALMADALVVAIDDRSETESRVLEVAEGRGLRLIGSLAQTSVGYQEAP